MKNIINYFLKKMERKIVLKCVDKKDLEVVDIKQDEKKKIGDLIDNMD